VSTIGDRLIRLIARAPASMHVKLIAAFFANVALLITVGALALTQLTQAHGRAEELYKLQRKIAAYRQLQNDTTAQLYTVASALLVPDERTLSATLRQLRQFGYDFDRLQFVASDEVDVLRQIEETHDEFSQLVTNAVGLMRVGDVAAARELEVRQAGPLADRLRRLTDQLVNKAEADMLASVEASRSAAETSRLVVGGFAAASIALALLLGYAISWSIIGPVKLIEARLSEIAAGDFSRRVDVPNRDELGALAADLNRTNDELGRLYAQLEAANRHKSQFLASMSHELRTPLNAVIGFSEILREQLFGQLNERQLRYVQHILEAGRHLLGLINDILDLSKIEAARMELHPESFDVADALQGVRAMLGPLIERKGQNLELAVAPGVATVYHDPARFQQVMYNLLSNANKFTPDGGAIRIRASVDEGRQLEVVVADVGVGIAAEDQERIFEQFRQVDTGYARAEVGTGLGLSLARQFARLMGGDIRVESELGVGSVFTFTLPLRYALPIGPDAGEPTSVAADQADAGRTQLPVDAAVGLVERTLGR
jgi:signal transduction histidine kinase